MSDPKRSWGNTFRCAASGAAHALRTQRNMRVHAAVAVLALALSIAFRISTGEFLAVLLFIALVFAAEIFNTALEAVVDLVSPEYHELARIAKDCAAGAVLVCAAVALLAGIVVFAPRIVGLFFG